MTKWTFRVIKSRQGSVGACGCHANHFGAPNTTLRGYTMDGSIERGLGLRCLKMYQTKHIRCWIYIASFSKHWMALTCHMLPILQIRCLYFVCKWNYGKKNLQCLEGIIPAPYIQIKTHHPLHVLILIFQIFFLLCQGFSRARIVVVKACVSFSNMIGGWYDIHDHLPM